MRPLLALLLLIAGAASAETFEIRLPTYCAAAETNFKTLEACPVNVILTAGANVTETTADASVELQGEVDGDVYVCLDLTTFDADADGVVDTDRAADCVADTGMEGQKTLAVSAPGVYTFSDGGDGSKFTLLTNDTVYFAGAVYVPDSSGDWHSRPDTTRQDDVADTSFQTVASGGTGLETANSYFIGVGGNDSNDGRSHANRWENRSKLDTITPAAGTNVWFLAGYTVTGEDQDINWAGDSDDEVEYGTYCMDGGTTPIEYDAADSDCSAGKAHFKGLITDACFESITCDFSPSGYSGGNAAVASRNDGLFDLNRDHIHLKNIIISHVKGRCVTIKGKDSGDANEVIEWTKFTGVEIEKCGHQPVVAENQISGLIVKDSSWELHAICEAQQRHGVSSALLEDGGTCSASQGGISSGFLIQSSPDANALFENVTAHSAYGERINCLNSEDVIIRNSTISGMRSNFVYPDACENLVVENSIFVGGSVDCAFPGAYTCPDPGNAVSVNVEQGQSTKGRGAGPVLVRNNIMVGVESCFRTALSNGAVTNGRDMNFEAYGNTCINPAEVAFSSTSNVNNNIIEYYAASNIIYDEDVSAQCTNHGANQDVNYNLWETLPPDTDCRGANDPSASAPSGFASYATFEAMHYNNLPTAANVTPDSAYAGDPNLETETHSIDFDTNFPQAIFDAMDTSMTKAEWNKRLHEDYSGTARDASAPTAGAIEQP